MSSALDQWRPDLIPGIPLAKQFLGTIEVQLCKADNIIPGFSSIIKRKTAVWLQQVDDDGTGSDLTKVLQAEWTGSEEAELKEALFPPIYNFLMLLRAEVFLRLNENEQHILAPINAEAEECGRDILSHVIEYLKQEKPLEKVRGE